MPIRVVVDDLFPCFPDGGPAYSRNHGNELWVMLLEKAYAKLRGRRRLVLVLQSCVDCLQLRA